MTNKKALIICQSIHHGNTMKVAEAIAEVLGAEIRKPSEVEIEKITEYDLIGFGSGIYDGKHHRSLFELINKLKTQNHNPVFIFSTAGVPFKAMHKSLKESLIDKNFDIIGEFQCKGFMNHSFTRYIFGGISKGKPNENDLKKAKDFAIEINNSF